MKNNFFINTLITLLICSSALAGPSELISDYDLRFYHPESYGVKDLVFEIRIENLTKELNSAKSYGKLEDVYFKIFWMFPGQYNIVIHGLPKGFKELRTSLKGQVKSRLPYVIPVKISPLVRSYNLKEEKSGGVKVVRATSKGKGNAMKSIDFKFNSKGQIKEMSSKGEHISIDTFYTHTTFPWSNSKWVLVNIIEKRMQGRHRLTMKSEIKYKKNGKYGFPEKINITTTPYIDQGNSKKKVDKRSILTSLEFTKYEINTGKAKKRITGSFSN